MNPLINTAGSTTLVIFFVCARVYPKETAVVFLLFMFFLFMTPFL